MLRRVLSRPLVLPHTRLCVRFVHKFDPPDLDTPLDTTYLPSANKIFLPYAPPTPQAWVHNRSFEKQHIVDLCPDTFDSPIRKDIVHRVVQWEIAASKRQTHYVPKKGEINKTTKKISPQKGMGRARHGSRYSNIFKGTGGKSFGPRGPRDHSYNMPEKVQNFGMRCALTAKHQEGNVFVLDHTMMESHKTSYFTDHFKYWGLHRPVMLYSEGELDANFILGCRNLYWFDLYPQHEVPLYEIVRHHEVIITEAALGPLQERLTRVRNPIEYVCPPLEELIAAGEVTVTVPQQQDA